MFTLVAIFGNYQELSQEGIHWFVKNGLNCFTPVSPQATQEFSLP